MLEKKKLKSKIKKRPLNVQLEKLQKNQLSDFKQELKKKRHLKEQENPLLQQQKNSAMEKNKEPSIRQKKNPSLQLNHNSLQHQPQYHNKGRSKAKVAAMTKHDSFTTEEKCKKKKFKSKNKKQRLKAKLDKLGKNQLQDIKQELKKKQPQNKIKNLLLQRQKKKPALGNHKKAPIYQIDNLSLVPNNNSLQQRFQYHNKGISEVKTIAITKDNSFKIEVKCKKKKNKSKNKKRRLKAQLERFCKIHHQDLREKLTKKQPKENGKNPLMQQQQKNLTQEKNKKTLIQQKKNLLLQPNNVLQQQLLDDIKDRSEEEITDMITYNPIKTEVKHQKKKIKSKKRKRPLEAQPKRLRKNQPQGPNQKWKKNLALQEMKKPLQQKEKSPPLQQNNFVQKLQDYDGNSSEIEVVTTVTQNLIHPEVKCKKKKLKMKSKRFHKARLKKLRKNQLQDLQQNLNESSTQQEENSQQQENRCLLLQQQIYSTLEKMTNPYKRKNNMSLQQNRTQQFHYFHKWPLPYYENLTQQWNSPQHTYVQNQWQYQPQHKHVCQQRFNRYHYKPYNPSHLQRNDRSHQNHCNHFQQQRYNRYQQNHFDHFQQQRYNRYQHNHCNYFQHQQYNHYQRNHFDHFQQQRYNRSQQQLFDHYQHQAWYNHCLQQRYYDYYQWYWRLYSHQWRLPSHFTGYSHGAPVDHY
ncbi:meiosis-specific nuclear structural protein 1-like isoform X2 [Prorops nasuta]|uniref:meiosis-specific nuclear structural protein 1-like isoform X2 n=1 Tax=Prorops nasuta TaxID=863751 RepID=UPI0034CD4867